jgi:TonB family protein
MAGWLRRYRMNMLGLGKLLWAVGIMASAGLAQTAAVGVPAAKDAVLEAASAEIGNALFLRCLCAENTLSFDAQGRLVVGANGTAAKTTDWTLAGMNVLKAERVQGGIELDGVRVAVRYAPDRREWDRHPQNTEKMKVVIADAGDLAGFRRALAKVFAMGMDVGFQRSLPEYWRHYFEPGLPWPKDELTDAKVLLPNAPGATEAQVTKKAEASYTTEAERDKVGGTVGLRMFITTEGLAKRVSIAQPLGYGLDARAVEATEKLRFTPARLASGQVENSYIVIRQEFVVVGR